MSKPVDKQEHASREQILNTIVQQAHIIITDKGEVSPELTSNTAFLADTPMDSLDLATLLVTLEMELGKDPFREGFKHFRTVQELADLY